MQSAVEMGKNVNRLRKEAIASAATAEEEKKNLQTKIDNLQEERNRWVPSSHSG